MRWLALLLSPAVLAAGDGGGTLPAAWSVAPFAILLTAIAVMPLLWAHAWHRWYPLISIGFGMFTALYYLVGLGDPWSLVHVGFEYATFITLLGSLYLCAGGVVVRINRVGGPVANLAILLGGALLANLVGTTGASLLLIRPFLAINRGRLRPYHVAFFIFFVSNCGGCLTPIGDPPLLIGFLRGIPFIHFAELAWRPWLLVMTLLSVAFSFCEWRNRVPSTFAPHAGRPILVVAGWRNVALLLAAVACVFLDPATVAWLPAIELHGERCSFVRELLMAGIGWLGLRSAHAEHHAENDFMLAPIREVALLFVGIFLTMLPALALIRHEAQSGTLFGIALTPMAYYLGTGAFSSILDNAPTFLAFLAGLQGQSGLDIPHLGSAEDPVVVASLTACLVAAVFWGAMTYIGNGPNFMVKAVVESARDDDGRPLVEVPSFFGYVLRFSVPILLPVLIVVGLVFFR